MSLLDLFCHVDDFWQVFAPHWTQHQLQSGFRRRQRTRQLCESEIMTILIHFHQQRYRDFKTYYTKYVQAHLKAEFPGLVSYTRFVELIPSVLLPLCTYLRACYGPSIDIAFIDSTLLAVCHNRRIPQHRGFAHIAARGKSSVGYQDGLMSLEPLSSLRLSL